TCALPILFDQIVAMREVDTAEDIGAVLAHRVDVYTSVSAPRRRRQAMLCGLLPVASGVSDPDLVRALEERAELITARARKVLHRASTEGHEWAVPGSAQALTIAAYRDRWAVNPADSRPLGPAVGTDFEQRTQPARAQAALKQLAADPHGSPQQTAAQDAGIRLDRGPQMT